MLITHKVSGKIPLSMPSQIYTHHTSSCSFVGCLRLIKSLIHINSLTNLSCRLPATQIPMSIDTEGAVEV